LEKKKEEDQSKAKRERPKRNKHSAAQDKEHLLHFLSKEEKFYLLSFQKDWNGIWILNSYDKVVGNKKLPNRKSISLLSNI